MPNRVNARKDKGDIEGAIIDFDKALCLDPKALDIIDDPDDALSLRNRGLH